MSGNITYSINIGTADVDDAGTDAAVKIQLIGEKGKSPEIPLDKAGNDFERKDFDVYKVTIDDIGDSKKVRVFHDNSGIAPGWCMGSLSIGWRSADDRQYQNWWPELGWAKAMRFAQHGPLGETTVQGLWLASDEGGTDKTLNLQTTG
ncbi:PLAT/LH2 domain-containing protein [Streptomyces sp. CA-132043]|uniref:PLAT/LH2 domain-containing protein n=1 Tax=Streptomyces sp. CA-132043 TaxID=3240048 RepID=UPI003D8BB2B3